MCANNSFLTHLANNLDVTERHILTVTLLFDNVACVAKGSICRDCEKAPRQHIICLHMY
jgi:hypothetical protein